MIVVAVISKAVVSQPPEPLKPGLRRYTPQPFRLGTWQPAVLEISLLRINVQAEGVEITFHLRAGPGARPWFIRAPGLMYEPPVSKRLRKNPYNGVLLSEDFEVPYIVDDIGGRFPTTTGFVGGRQGYFSDYYFIRAVLLDPGETAEVSAKFPMINPIASSITFVSPRINGWQDEWQWRASLR